MPDQAPNPDHELQHQLAHYAAEIGSRLEFYRTQQAIRLQVNQAALDSANAALRASILINGGAAVAVLALLSTQSGSEFVATVLSALWWFVIAVLGGAIATGVSYVTNYLYAVGQSDADYDDELNEKGKSRINWNWCMRGAIAAHLISVILVILTYLGFFIGVVNVARGIQTNRRVARGRTAPKAAEHAFLLFCPTLHASSLRTQ